MTSGDGPQWDAQSQRWEWGPQPSPAPASPSLPPQSGAVSGPPPPPAVPPAMPRYEPWAPEPPRGGPGPERRWQKPLLVGVAAAVVGGAAVAGWFVVSGKDEPAAAPSPPASGAASAAPSTAATGPATSPAKSASPSASATSPGYSVVHNETGFSVAVPTGWQRSYEETGSGSFYRLPGDRSALLQVFRVTEDASISACELLRMSSKSLDDATPAYREVSIDQVSGTACELAYEYDSAESQGRRRGIERIITTSDGKRWALLAAGPAADERAVRANLTAALDSFRPD